jgi:hypothetical protein
MRSINSVVWLPTQIPETSDSGSIIEEFHMGSALTTLMVEKPCVIKRIQRIPMITLRAELSPDHGTPETTTGRACKKPMIAKRRTTHIPREISELAGRSNIRQLLRGFPRKPK